MPSITLHLGREKSLLRHHPWIFSGAVARVDGNPDLGETVDIFSANGDFGVGDKALPAVFGVQVFVATCLVLGLAGLFDLLVQGHDGFLKFL